MVKILLYFVGLSCLYGQCCSPGNPLGGQNAIATLPAGSLATFLNFKYGNSSQYFNESTKTSGIIESGKYSFAGVNVSYGISNRALLESETGYMISKSQQYSAGILPSYLKATGLTDQLIGLKVAFLKSVKRELEMGAGLGIKFPLGNPNASFKGAVLPRDLQTTTGSTDFIHTAYVYKGFLKRHLRFFLTNRFEQKGTNPDNYHYGNLVATSFYTTWSKLRNFVLVSEIRSEVRNRDRRLATGYGIPVDSNKELVIPTGSEKIILSPQFIYYTNDLWSFSVIGDIPIYQRYNDKQLGNSFAFGISIRRQWALKQKS